MPNLKINLIKMKHTLFFQNLIQRPFTKPQSACMWLFILSISKLTWECFTVTHLQRRNEALNVLMFVQTHCPGSSWADKTLNIYLISFNNCNFIIKLLSNKMRKFHMRPTIFNCFINLSCILKHYIRYLLAECLANTVSKLKYAL